MPFLFVDYDGGAGGEYLCKILSDCDQCNTLDFFTYNGRYKVKDKYNQAWLTKLDTSYDLVLSSSSDKYDLIPSHRNTALARSLLGPIKSIRISNPIDLHLWSFLKYNHRKKVLMVRSDYSAQELIGDIKVFTNNTSENQARWLKKINKNTLNIDLRLMFEKQQHPCDSNRLDFIRKNFNAVDRDEPNFDFDLIIPFEKLILDHNWVVQAFKDSFNIDLPIESLSKYYDSYVKYALYS